MAAHHVYENIRIVIFIIKLDNFRIICCPLSIYVRHFLSCVTLNGKKMNEEAEQSGSILLYYTKNT